MADSPSSRAWTAHTNSPLARPSLLTPGVIKKRRKEPRVPAKKLSFIPVYFLGLMAFIGCLYQYSLTLQFCSFDGSEVKEYIGKNPLGYFMPSCVQCPRGGVCENREVKSCATDMILTYPFYSKFVYLSFDPSRFIPVFPFNAKTCSPDVSALKKKTELDKQMSELEGRVLTGVRGWIGKVMCNDKVKKELLASDHAYVVQV